MAVAMNGNYSPFHIVHRTDFFNFSMNTARKISDHLGVTFFNLKITLTLQIFVSFIIRLQEHMLYFIIFKLR